jgi:hypothetical protein
VAWTHNRLLQEWSILLGLSHDNFTIAAYTSALNSFLTFCELHRLPIELTAETLSLYITFQSSFIAPASIASYLPGICNELEVYFLNVRESRVSHLVTRTLKGAMRRHNRGLKRKAPLMRPDLDSAFVKPAGNNHDELLFLAMLTVRFYGLLRLGETTFLDTVNLRDWKKVTTRPSLEWLEGVFAFWLPRHKSDTYFEGNRIFIKAMTSPSDPFKAMLRYLGSRDRLHPLHPALWVQTDRSVPTRGWFLDQLRQLFPPKISGHSLCAGRATALAKAGRPLN